MKKDGTADKIAEKWLGSGADLDKSDAKQYDSWYTNSTMVSRYN